jgi:hypothetical protein
MEVPSGASQVTFTISGSSGNANLYVKHGSTVSASSYDCRSTNSGDSDSCTITSPDSGTWSVMLYGNTAYSGVSLEGDYQ